MAEKTLRVYLHYFLKDMLELFAVVYGSRKPSKHELAGIEPQYNEEVFNGCERFLDCLKLKWETALSK